MALSAPGAFAQTVGQANPVREASVGATSDAADEAPARITVGTALDLVGNPVRWVPATALPNSQAPASQGPFSPYLDSRSPFFPVSSRAITSAFGMRVHPLLGGLRLHGGVDLAAPQGSPVVATMDGIVDRVGSYGNYGLLVGVEAPEGLETRFAHLSRLNVVSGQAVRRGQLLGWSGSTGLTTGPHLHYEVRIKGKPVNPIRR
jgi:murein DD-endopeptidase MepM/ murein hydrolase activator NlpD